MKRNKLASGLESDDDKEEDEGQVLKKYKRPNMADIGHVISKSRNAKSRINYEQKSRIFAQDLQNPFGVKKYMLDLFQNMKENEDMNEGNEDYYEEDSPIKEQPGKLPLLDDDGNTQDISAEKTFDD